MRIAMVTTCQFTCPANGWGSEEYIWSIVECLNKYGHEVMLFAKEGSKCPAKGELIICSSEIEVLEKHRDVLHQVDIVHDWSAVKSVHDYCQEKYIRSIASNFNIHFLYPTIHKNIVCVSDIHRYLGLSGKNGFEGTPWYEQVGYTGFLNDAKRIYLGIDLNLYTPKFEKQDFILFMNSWDYRKGVTIALDLAKNMGFKLILAGSTQHPEHIQTFNELKPMMDKMPNVSYECDVSNARKIELMRNAKALLFPSLFDQPFAVVVIEALACGTPVIATNRGAMPEMIQHGKTGFLCNNINEMATAINTINTLNGADCRVDVINRFDRDIMTKEYIKLYEMILSGEYW